MSHSEIFLRFKTVTLDVPTPFWEALFFTALYEQEKGTFGKKSKQRTIHHTGTRTRIHTDTQAHAQCALTFPSIAFYRPDVTLLNNVSRCDGCRLNITPPAGSVCSQPVLLCSSFTYLPYILA